MRDRTVLFLSSFCQRANSIYSRIWNATDVIVLFFFCKEKTEEKMARGGSKGITRIVILIVISQILAWGAATTQARTELGIVGFVPCRKGTPLYQRTRKIYDAGQSS